MKDPIYFGIIPEKAARLVSVLVLVLAIAAYVWGMQPLRTAGLTLLIFVVKRSALDFDRYGTRMGLRWVGQTQPVLR